MTNLIDLLYKYNANFMIDISRMELARQEPTYLEESNKLDKYEQQYNKMDFTEEQRSFLETYITCIQTTNGQLGDISYMAGFRDAIIFLQALGLIGRIE